MILETEVASSPAPQATRREAGPRQWPVAGSPSACEPNGGALSAAQSERPRRRQGEVARAGSAGEARTGEVPAPA